MKICPICGYPNPDDAIYCINCGYWFPTTSQQPPQQPSPPQNPAQPGAPSGYGLTPDEIDGLKKIRKSSLFYILGLILLLIAIIPALISIGIIPYSISSIVAFIAASLATLALIIAGGIISILSFFYLFSAYSSLRRVDSDFNLPYYGLLLDLIAAIIGVLGATALLVAGAATFNLVFVLAILPLSILVAVIGIIGYVMGYIIGPFRLSSRYDEGDFKIAGIMYIVGIFIGIFTIIGIISGFFIIISTISGFFAIIGTIFMYAGAGRVLRRAGVP